MSHRRIVPRLALASLVAALVAAAPAPAMPIDPQGSAGTDPRQQDMHASTVVPPEEQGGVQDRRGEAAAGGGTGTGETGGPVREPAVQGPPTWPAHPTPLPLPGPQQPVAVADDGDDIGVDLPVALLVLAGTLALGGGLTVAAMKTRARMRTAH